MDIQHNKNFTKNTKYYLLRFEKDWRDEFYFTEYSLITEKEKIDMEDKIKEYPNNISLYFGTNEGWDDIEPKDILSSLQYEEISKDIYDSLTLIHKGVPYSIEEIIEECKETKEYIIDFIIRNKEFLNKFFDNLEKCPIDIDCDNCPFKELEDEEIIQDFDCGDVDIIKNIMDNLELDNGGR